MKHRIAILSDIHGNTTALEAVIKDAQELGATEYWLMGDICYLDQVEMNSLNFCLQFP